MSAAPSEESSQIVVEIRVAGAAGPYALSLFQGFDHVVEPVTTTMRGSVGGSDELNELCHRLRDAGIELVSLRRLDREPPAP